MRKRDAQWRGIGTQCDNPPVCVILVCLVIGVAWPSAALGAEIIGWGRDDDGQINVPAGNDFVDMSAGWRHGLALKTDGSIVGWAWDAYG